MFVRTVTFFFNALEFENPVERLKSFVSRVNTDYIRSKFSRFGIDVLNFRLVVSPPRDENELVEFIKVMKNSEFDYFGGIGTFGVNELTVSVIEALKEFDRLTAFISVKDLKEAEVAGMLVRDLLKNDIASARLIVGINPPRFSPYLPYSFIKDPAIHYGFSIAINRVSDLKEVIDGNDFEDVKKAVFFTLPKIAYPVHEIAKDLWPTYLGIDVSLAPMPGVKEESVGELLVKLAGKKLYGAMGYIQTINEALREYTLLAPLVGYNRVMTPLGEDHVLADLASRSVITLDTLKARSSVCSTGVDVVPVRPEKVVGTIVDTIAIGLEKEKTIGARLIPRDLGDRVDLGPIGEAPVL